MTFKLEIWEQEGKTGYIEPHTSSDQRTFYWKYTGETDDIKSALQGLERIENILPHEDSTEAEIIEMAHEPENYKELLEFIGEYLDSVFPEIWRTKLIDV